MEWLSSKLVVVTARVGSGQWSEVVPAVVGGSGRSWLAAVVGVVVVVGAGRGHDNIMEVR